MSSFLLAVLLNVSALAQPPGPISGTVIYPQGSIVPNVNVRLEVAGASVGEVRTASDGTFEFRTDATENIRVIVTAPGFTQAVISISSRTTRTMQIALQPAPFFEAIQVTSSRGDVAQSDPTVTTSAFPASDLLTSGSLTIDDALKMVPGFTLFPSSRVSNPTSQTLMLRGLGGSGVSRALVLADGVSLNDAFGGWVYWDKVPHAAIDRVEVLRGGGGDLYGPDAVGGVVQILTLHPDRATARALVEGGNLGTGRVSLFGGGRTHGWSYTAAGEWFTTDGYIIVPDDERGPVDTKAGSTHRSAMASVGFQASNLWRFDIRGNAFSEDRNSGTLVQVNDTDARQGTGEVAGSVAGGAFSAHVFGGTQGYDQTFSAVSAEPPRGSEDLDRIQHVPTDVAGSTVQWVHPWRRHSVLVGAEARFINGHTVEREFAGGRVVGTSDDGGKQRVGAAFVRATFLVTDRLTVVAGAHGDGWHSEARNQSFSQTVGSFSPRASFSYRIADSGVVVRGSVYGGFRAPTLNELYRGFRIGNNVTNPNERLRPEKLKAGEGGLLVSHGRASARVTGFWNVLTDTITNVTIATSPELNIRQRQNADKMRSAGVELEGDLRLPRSVTLSITSALTSSRFKGQTRLRNYRVPQVPTYTVGLNARYDSRAWTISGQLRVTGPQFDDDVNTLLLRRATVFDAFGSRRIARGLNAFVAVENLFDSDYDVGRLPTRTTGLPRAVRTGIQVALPVSSLSGE